MREYRCKDHVLALGPGLKIWGWPYPVVAFLNPGFRLRAVLPLHAAAAPTGGGCYRPPKRGQKRYQKVLDRARGTSVRVRDASWPIGRAWHAVGAPPHAVTPPPTPVWARFGRKLAQKGQSQKMAVGLDGPILREPFLDATPRFSGFQPSKRPKRAPKTPGRRGNNITPHPPEVYVPYFGWVPQI